MNGRGVDRTARRLRRMASSSAAYLALIMAVGVCLPAAPARAGDPMLVVSITSGGGTDVCDTNCTTCTVGSGECIHVVQTDLLLCRPLSSGLPITSCDWSVFLQGASPNLQINNQIRAADIAPNGNITFVSLNDTVVPGIGSLAKEDIAVLNPDDLLKPFVGGGPYDDGTFKLYLNGALSQQDEPAKPWDAFELLSDGTCEKAISATTTAPHTCPLIGSLTSGSGTAGLGGVHFSNEDLLRCRPTAFAMNGTIEGCDFAMFLDSSNINAGMFGTGNGITSDIEAIDFLGFTPSTMTGQMVFKMASGNPPGFPAHNAGKDLLLYNGTFGAGNCVMSGDPCADASDCGMGDTCFTGTCNIGGGPCAADGDCTGTGNFCNSQRYPAGTVTKFFDGVAVGLTGTGQNIEAFALLPEGDGDGVPDGIDNCPSVTNPPSVCSGGTATCPSGLSTECPMGETCVQADADQDGVGDACDQCNGRPDPGVCDGCPGIACPPICNSSPATVECACGDGILDLPSEQCDLGGSNGPSSPCSASCAISGHCTGSMASCTTAADCPMGEGCCGNDIVESPEACDDGNVIEDDTCTSACALAGGTPILGCEDLTGPNIVPASIKITKFSDKPTPADFDRWKTKGQFVFTQGLTIDPDTQPVKIIYNNTLSGELFSSQLDPGDCNPPLASCFIQSGTLAKPKWKFLDKEADVAGAPSWHKGKLKIKNVNTGIFNLDGRNQTLFTSAEVGGPTPTLRQTIRIGDVCVTGVLSCLSSGNGKTLKCALAP